MDSGLEFLAMWPPGTCLTNDIVIEFEIQPKFWSTLV